MKISSEHYSQLRDDIREVAKAYNIDVATADGGKTGLKMMHALHAVVDQNRAYDDQHPIFTRGAKRVLPFTGRNYCHLYDAGLDDTHITTALKKIKAELIEENK